MSDAFVALLLNGNISFYSDAPSQTFSTHLTSKFISDILRSPSMANELVLYKT
jgi:hypothetical protein